MLQFYFLSILLNLIAGLIFIYVVNGERETGMVLSDSASDGLDLNLDGESSESSDAAFESPAKEKSGSLKELAVPFLGDKTFQLVVGILSALTGLMKLLSPIQYDIAIIGDLVPSLAGLFAGAVLLLDWYQDHSEIELTLPGSLQDIYTGGRKYLGIFCVIAAVLHFIFPRVLFL